MEKGDLGEEGFDLMLFFVLVLHLSLGVILRLSMTEEWNLVSLSTFVLGRKRNGAVVVAVAVVVSLSFSLSLLLLSVLLERKLQLRGVDGLEPNDELLKNRSLRGLGDGSPRTGESPGFRGIVVQKARRQPVPIWCFGM